ncbi:MAG: hypothetical protein J3Q66DRAFT_371792 [Benniella sp.]|nr:MAG: hypothetical protein J3Q66DRAFT_371792 [Benniella sp.]
MDPNDPTNGIHRPITADLAIMDHISKVVVLNGLREQVIAPTQRKDGCSALASHRRYGPFYEIRMSAADIESRRLVDLESLQLSNRECLREMLNANGRRDIQVVAQAATKYPGLLGPSDVVEPFESYMAFEEL